MKEPTRLSDDPALPPSLRHDLDVATRARAPFDHDAGLARLMTAIAAGAVTTAVSGASAAQLGASATGAGGATGGAVGMVGNGAAAGGASAVAGNGAAAGGASAVAGNGFSAKAIAFLVGKGAYWGLAAAGVASVTLTISFATDNSHHPSSPPHPPAAVAPAPAPTSAPAPAADPPATPVLGATPDLPAAASTSTSAAAASAKPVAPPTSADRSRLSAEVRDLADLRARLADHPAEALAGADSAAVAFTGGTLAEEREALAIEALVKLHRRDEARARAAAFAATHPRSPLAAHVRSLVAE